MYNTNGFSKLGFNVNKIEEFAKNQLKGKTKITTQDIELIDKKLHHVLSKAGDDVLKSNRSLSKSRSPSLKQVSPERVHSIRKILKPSEFSTFQTTKNIENSSSKAI